MPAVMNAANEVAVADFLADKIGFLDIADMVEEAMGRFNNIENPSIEDIISADAEVREYMHKR